MAKASVIAGSTNNTFYVMILNSTSATGGRKLGLTYDTSGLTAYYTRTREAATAITLATQTVTGAWSSGGFVLVHDTNQPGLYRIDVPDAAFAAGADFVTVSLYGASGMAQVDFEIEIVHDARFGTVNDGSATTTAFVAAGTFSSQNDGHNNQILVFISGNNRGIGRTVTDFVTATPSFVTEAFPVAPANGDRFMLIGLN